MIVLQPEWLSLPAVRKMHGLFAQGHIPYAFVGGAVRDAVLGRAPSDFDMVTSAPAEGVRDVLRDGKVHSQLRDAAKGLVVFYIDKFRFDIVTLPHFSMQKPFPKRVESFLHDTFDFTMNALFMLPEGELHDPFGGAADAKAGRVCFLVPAQESLAKNPYHILRYFRMLAEFGAGQADAAIVALCREYTPRLPEIVGWKRYEIILKMAGLPYGLGLLEQMQEEGILRVALDFMLRDFAPLYRLEAIGREHGLKIPVEARMLLMALAADRPAAQALALLGQPMLWNE
ncbi:MAG: hypothetical protein K2Q01_07870, partial [Rickettsiales bacterium]|nr:hypothetical protein [Rickettsiales bacterium]